MFIVAMEMQQ